MRRTETHRHVNSLVSLAQQRLYRRHRRLAARSLRLRSRRQNLRRSMSVQLYRALAALLAFLMRVVISDFLDLLYMRAFAACAVTEWQ